MSFEHNDKISDFIKDSKISKDRFIKNNLPEIIFTIIYDNCACNLNLKKGFGFSCFIQYRNKKILFDTGGDSKAFFQNIKKLNVKLTDVTHVVFSHQHWDHTAGFKDVLQKMSDNTQIYLPSIFSKSLLKEIPKNLQLNCIKDFLQIDNYLYSLVLKGRLGVAKKCSFIYEQVLIFKISKGLVVLTGCGHPGILNIANYVSTKLCSNIYLLIGGFHLHHSFGSTIDAIVKEVQLVGVQNIAPCHCTGKEAVDKFRKAYNNNFYNLGTGSVLKI